jgi:release factor glutamine methyltransferase
VYGCDISAYALSTASSNALQNSLPVDFFHADILSHENPLPNQSLDMIVSNPPYVKRSEMAKMHINVLQHEPHLALFVDDDDALIFYRVIAHKAIQMLKSGGQLFFEINEALGHDTRELLSQMGYGNIELRSDINGRHRMIKASKERGREEDIRFKDR